MFFLDELVQVPVPDDLFPVETAHLAVAAPEGVEIQAKNRRVQEAVLTEDVDGLVLDRRSAQDQLVPGLVPQLVHGLALGGVVGLDPLALIRYDEVRIEAHQGVDDVLSPGGLVVDHSHLQVWAGEPLKVRQLLQALGLGPQHGADGVGEGGVILKLLRPDGADRGGGHNQHPLHLAHLVPGPGHGDGGQGLAAAHLEQKAEAFTLLLCCHVSQSPPFIG